MSKRLLTLLGVAATLAGCQPTPSSTASPAATGAPTPVPTEAAARAAVVRYLQTQPNAALYLPDSARVLDVTTHWQVLVPRTDYAQRMPNRARFEEISKRGRLAASR